MEMQQDTVILETSTQCQLSWQKVQVERNRVRKALDRRHQTHWHKHLATVSQSHTASPAKIVTGVRR